jgi:hypothetical protein
MPQCHNVARQVMMRVEIRAANSCTVKVITTPTPKFSGSKNQP